MPPERTTNGPSEVPERGLVKRLVQPVVVGEQQVRDQGQVDAVLAEREVRDSALDISVGVGRVVGEESIGGRPEVVTPGFRVTVEVPDEQVPFLLEL